MSEVDRQRRALLWMTVAAVCWRWLLAAKTPVPAQDGCNYLWMAERFADGDTAAALSEPFSPLWPLLLSVPIRLGMEPELAAKLLGSILGGALVWPVAWIAERLRSGAGLAAGVLALSSSLLARTAVEGYTEPLFVLVMASGVVAGMRGSTVCLALFSALAFLVRPEGVLLPLPFVLLQRRLWPVLVTTALVVVAFGWWRQAVGLGFDPVPKLAFHSTRVELGGEQGAVFANLLQLPSAFFEAYLCASLLAVLALLAPRPRGGLPLLLLLLAGLLVIVTFVVRRRFCVAYAFALLPFAAVGWVRLAMLGVRGREVLLSLVVLADLWTAWQGTISADRIAERIVGEHLAERTAPDERIYGDLTRVLYFAGQRPLPARRIDVEDIVGAANDDPAVRFVVLSARSGRGNLQAVQERLAPSFVAYPYPIGVGEQASVRGIVTLVRR